MEYLKQNYKAIVTFLIILILLEVVVVWYMLQQFRENYLSGPEALSCALADAGYAESEVRGTDIDLRHKSGKAWYEVEFESDGVEYRYEIDAETGEILSAQRKAD